MKVANIDPLGGQIGTPGRLLENKARYLFTGATLPSGAEDDGQKNRASEDSISW